MTFRIGSWTTIVPAFLLLASAAHAQVCSNITTVGRYYYVCDGFLTPAPNSSLAMTKILGTVTADATGTFRGGGTVSMGGVTINAALVGTQKLNSDCTGTISYTQTINGQAGPPLNIFYVVSEQGNRIDGLVTDSGTVMSCVLGRLSNNLPATTASTAATKALQELASRSTARPETKSQVSR